MTHDPRTTEEVYEGLRDSLTGKIAKLSNFTSRSFNYVWAQAFSAEIRDLQLRALGAEFAGWIDYAGGPVDETDLERLGISDSVTPEEIEQYTDDHHLEELVKLVGVERFEGATATGAVDIDTDPNREVTIPEGTLVSTQTDSSGESLIFETVERVTVPDGTTTGTDINIIAQEVGEEHNVPAGTIIRFPEPPVGVTGVTNPSSTTGGLGEESNDELRQRAKNAVVEQAGGGTVEGIRGFIISEIDAVQSGDVLLEEFTDLCPPYVDVVVDGGSDQEVEDAIESSRPVAIRHNLIRPETTQISADIVLTGTDINQLLVRQTVEDFLLELGLSEPFYERALLREIMSVDENILNVGQLEVSIESHTNEAFTYATGTDQYALEYTYADDGSMLIVDSSGDEYVEDTDFEVIDRTDDAFPETIDWSINAVSPDDGEDYFVDYNVDSPANIVRDEINVMNFGLTNTFTFDPNEEFYRLDEIPFESSVTITDDSSDTYIRGTDFTVESRPENDATDTFIYQSGRTDYKFDFTTKADTVSITDENDNTFTRGTDYTVIDKSGDGRLKTIRWDENESTPAADAEFTVEYTADNYIPQSIVWDNAQATPDDAEQFTVTYDQGFYDLDQEVVDAPDDIIKDENQVEYVEDTDFEFADDTADGEDDGILWIDGATAPSAGEEFYSTYFTEGNLFFEVRQKADPGSIVVTTQ